MHGLAAPLVRWRVPPNVLTLAGVASAFGAVVTRPPSSAALVLWTAVCDGLDGAVALQRGRPSRHGAFIDHAADRATDVLFAAALWQAGANVWPAVADGATVIGYEASRSAARRRGVAPALVTVGERPIRVAVTAIGIVVAPTAAAVVVTALNLASLVQLRRWRDHDRPT